MFVSRIEFRRWSYLSKQEFITFLLTGFRELGSILLLGLSIVITNRFPVKGNIFCENRIISVRLIKYSL